MKDKYERKAIDELLRRLKSGDDSAFAELYAGTSRQLYVLCCSFFPRREDAEDALTDAYVKIKQECGVFKGSNGFNWMYTITKNICLNILARNKRQINVDFDDEKTQNTLLSDAYFEISDSDESGVIKTARKVLNENEFTIVILHAVDGYKFNEIAVMLKANEATVRWQYNNALKKVKKIMEKEDDEAIK